MLIRIVIRKNDDPTRDLEVAGDLRRDLWAHSPVEIDPDDPENATRRDGNGSAYFDFETDMLEEVQRVIEDYDYSEKIEVNQRVADCWKIIPTPQNARKSS